VIRFRTAAIGGLLLSLLLNACSSGAGGMLPTAQHTGNIPSLIGGTTPQTTGRLPVAVNCPSIAAPGDSRIGIHSQPTQRLGGATVPNLVGGIALPERPSCGSGIARPKRTMAWSGCSSGQQDFGCNTHQSPGDGMVWVPEACAWLTGYQGQESCTPGFWESGCAAMGLPNNCGGGGSGYIPGAPCQPISSCLARLGLHAEPGAACEGSGKVVGGWVGGTGDTGGNEIKNIYEVQVNAAGSSEIVGWVYTTFTAGIWFQPNLSVSLSDGAGVVSIGVGASTPTVSIGGLTPGNFQSAMGTFDAVTQIAAKVLPPPYNAIASAANTIKMDASKCYTFDWNGKYPG